MLVDCVRVHRVNDTVSLSYFYCPATVLWCSSDVSLGSVSEAGACASISQNQTWRSSSSVIMHHRSETNCRSALNCTVTSILVS